MKKEVIKIILASALCLGVLTVGFFTVHNLSLAAETEGVELPEPEINQPAVATLVVNETPEISEESQKTEIAFEVVLNSSNATPDANTLSAEAAAEIGAQYILDMFGVCVDGKTITMTYWGQHPSQTRSIWGGSIGRTYFYDEDSQRMIEDTDTTSSTINRFMIEDTDTISFSIDAVTGERISIHSNADFPELSEEVRAALEEIFNNSDGRATEEMIALRTGAPVEYDKFIEAVRAHAQRHFVNTEIVSVEFMTANAIAYNLDENGNLYITNRQLIFEVIDSTGRVAEMAVVEATKRFVWLDTSTNDIIPGFNYMGETPGLG